MRSIAIESDPIESIAMKKALLVGINDYQCMPALRGCVNDARLMGALVSEQFLFAEGEIRTLLDGEAHFDSLYRELQWLFSNSGEPEEDTLFFYYSGHGYIYEDRDGDERDGLDEVLCAVDYRFDVGSGPDEWRHENGVLDDELRRLVEGLHPSTRVEIVVDSCHSGGMFDFERGPVACQGRLPGNVVVWSASRELEVAKENHGEDVDHAGETYGAFTQVLHELVSGKRAPVSRRQMFSALREEMKRRGHGQAPVLFCPDILERQPFLCFS